MEKRKVRNQSRERHSWVKALSVFVILYLVVVSIFIYIWVQNNIIPKAF